MDNELILFDRIEVIKQVNGYRLLKEVLEDE